jgi:polysaccharide export outer membrane protein
MRFAHRSYIRAARLGLTKSLLLLPLLTGCATSTGKFVWIDDLSPAQTRTADDMYRIAAHDGLTVLVYQHVEMSGPIKVRSDGNITVGLLGDVVAAGKTPPALALEIENLLRARNLIGTATKVVTVAVDDAAPIRVSVMGEVAQTGLLSLAPGSGLSEALASSGGFSEFAHRDRIYVLRRTPELVRIRFRFADLVQGKGNAGTFQLRSGDIVVVE